MRRLTLLEANEFYDTVRELAQFALDSRGTLSPVAGPLAVLAIEYATGKRSGYSGADALAAIAKKVNDAQRTIVQIYDPALRCEKKDHFLAG